MMMFSLVLVSNNCA